ncbi:MAG TPA: acyltransferase [Steroidobacteraceae bacterium]|nr:acyltransferase [Steroidobacteraceae bacterium]
MSTVPEAAIQISSTDPTPPAAIPRVDSAKQRPGSIISGHLPALDGVRGLAILAVLLFHFLAPTNPTGLADRAITWLFAYGALGVDLFFILSGFLITGILYDSRNDPGYFRNFYMRRVLRIFPLYYGVLIIVFFVVPAIPALRDSEIGQLRSHQAWAWLYCVNIYLAIHNGWVLSYIEHFWSLAVEEQFYFVWPFMVWLLAANRRVFLVFSLATALASFGGRIVASLMGVSSVATTVLTPFELDALAIGGFLAVYLRDPHAAAGARRAVLPLTLAGIAVMLVQFALRHFTTSGNAVESVRSGAFHLLLTALLLKALLAPPTSGWSRFFCSRPMITLGKYSYGLYVYHHFFSHYFTAHATDVALGSLIGSRLAALGILAVGGIAASMGIAWLSFEYFEKFFLQLKRFWHSRPQPASVARHQ